MADGRQSEDYLQALAIYDSIFPRYQSAEPQSAAWRNSRGLKPNDVRLLLIMDKSWL